VQRQYLKSSPAHEKLKLEYGPDRPTFRTICEIQEIRSRDGLASGETLDLWECFYLCSAEIAVMVHFEFLGDGR
jgi:hypothetical protein